ncbi:MAG: hypothetical protein ABR538_16020, partial [Candidatus Binatia bacterium]
MSKMPSAPTASLAVPRRRRATLLVGCAAPFLAFTFLATAPPATGAEPGAAAPAPAAAAAAETEAAKAAAHKAKVAERRAARQKLRADRRAKAEA